VKHRHGSPTMAGRTRRPACDESRSARPRALTIIPKESRRSDLVPFECLNEGPGRLAAPSVHDELLELVGAYRRQSDEDSRNPL
jgi:hypothetical protein